MIPHDMFIAIALIFVVLAWNHSRIMLKLEIGGGFNFGMYPAECLVSSRDG